VRDRALELARDLFADHRAHRAAHELEHEEADLAGDAADGCGACAICVAGAHLLGRVLDLIDVALAIDPEPQRVTALELPIVLLEAPGIDHELDSGLRWHPEMVLAARADSKVAIEICFIQRRVTPLALYPNPFRDGLFGLLCEPLRAGPPCHSALDTR